MEYSTSYTDIKDHTNKLKYDVFSKKINRELSKYICLCSYVYRYIKKLKKVSGFYE